MNLACWLQRTAHATPDREALFLGTNCVATYAEFHNAALCVAGALRAQGVQPGDRIGIFMKNCPDYLIAFYGVWYAGGVVVPINAKLHGREAAFIIENAQADIVFASGELREDLQKAHCPARILEAPGAEFRAMKQHDGVKGPAARSSDDLAWLFYTSGTTGAPKGVMITHRMLTTMSLSYQVDCDRVQAQDAALYAAPLSHGAGIYNMVHVRAGARHVCPPSGGFDADEILDLAEKLGSVHMFAAPTMVKRMVEAAKASGRHGQGLRSVIYAGGPMYVADILEAVDHFGPVFAQIYGQGECPMGITALTREDVQDRTHPNWEARLASVGRAQSAVEVAIGTPDGQLLPVGSHGEIMVRGDVVMPGYWRNPEATEKTLVNGWLMTGDMGVMDASGYVTLQDRSKDMIISGGSNIYPREVEEVLLQHPGVREASVVGHAHPEWGEEVVAFIVGEASERELDALCLEHIARFKRPRRYERLASLPKNNYGKVLKTELRARLAET